MHQTTAPQPLPLSWIEKIFRKLSARYGRSFMGQYDGVPLEDVMADWSEELAGLTKRPEAIAHAIGHLPDRVPNVAEFRKLCLGAPVQALALPSPPADPVRVQAEMSKLGRKPAGVNVYTDWISRGLADLEAGIKRSPAVEKAVRDAAKAKGLCHA